MNAQEISQEAGIPVGQPGGQSGAVGSAPMDPAAAAAAQQGAPPAGAPPVDPAAAGGDPMSGAAAGGPQPTIEEMAASGDPISKEFIELKKKVNLILDVLLALADKVQLQMPASESYQSRLREIESESKKQSGVLDSTDDDYDEQPAVRQEPVLGLRVVKTAGAASKDETQSMGQAVVPTNTNRFIQTPKVGNTSTRLMWESHK